VRKERPAQNLKKDIQILIREIIKEKKKLELIRKLRRNKIG
jgi:hypothetical protein